MLFGGKYILMLLTHNLNKYIIVSFSVSGY